MLVIGQKKLRDAGAKDLSVRQALAIWPLAPENADWRDLMDVRKTFPHADGVRLKSGLVVTVFNVKGNNFRLLTWIDYGVGTIEVLEIPGHTAYSRESWKSRY